MLSVVLAIYVVGVNIFKDNFMPNTFINGKDFSLTNKSKLYENYNSKYGEYKLKLLKEIQKKFCIQKVLIIQIL